MFRISVVVVSLLDHIKQKHSNSFGPGLLKSTVCVKKEILVSLGKESLLSWISRKLQGLGITGMEKRFFPHSGKFNDTSSELSGAMWQVKQQELLSPTCKPNSSVIETSNSFLLFWRASALCYTHLHKALATPI